MAGSSARIDAVKQQLKAKGFEQKAILSEREFKELFEEVMRQPGAVATPDDELRYLEGMFNLPIHFISGFWAIPADDSKKCVCGRIPNAFDIVITAVRRKIHDRDTLRDTLIGYQNIFEFAKDGRVGECVNCGRSVKMVSYWKKDYVYV